MAAFEIEVVLAVYSPAAGFLLLRGSLPSRPLSADRDSRSEALDVFAALTGFDPSWVSVTQAGFVERGDRRSVLYSAAVPARCVPADPDARWCPAEELRGGDRDLAALSIQYRG